ncbi:hypothetical protein BRC94_02800 [Halobacteriales archaeon QS_5_70_17]|jgi:hypothetical protein|nr:MAG: hypothetical protein BRC94_02800 [Halobacteriales archaeon QS_5_70_17]
MELTRRDALAALAGAGVVGGGGAAVLARDPFGEAGPDDSPGATTAVLPTLTAAAEVVYPSDLDGIGEFVETYALGRVADRPDDRDGLASAVREVDAAAREWYGAAYADLDRSSRDEVLRELGADAADPDPAGSRAERVRYYVVNELLYALYTSPAGADLVGVGNVVGHAGGTEAYRREP